MAAFSYEHHPFLLDNSFFLPSSPIKIMSNCLEENINSNGFSHFYPHESIQEIPADFGMHESSFLEHSSKGAYFSHNEANSLTKKQIGTESSTVVDKLDSGDQVIQKAVSPMMKKMNNRNGASLNCAQPKDLTEGKTKKQKKCNGTQKEDEKKPKAEKEGKKDGKEPPTGYIHVRARRGQATDSHSLAERLRREKISERMKILQGLVPGCDKVTGKALMLDEIINYVQSLQNQVEFLSMKLGSVNDPMFYDLGLMKLERLTRMASPLSTGHATHCSPMSSNQPTTANNYYPIIHVNTASPNAINANANVFSQDIACIFSEVEDQRQNFLVPSEFGNNLCFFH